MRENLVNKREIFIFPKVFFFFFDVFNFETLNYILYRDFFKVLLQIINTNDAT